VTGRKRIVKPYAGEDTQAEITRLQKVVRAFWTDLRAELDRDNEDRQVPACSGDRDRGSAGRTA
jgi:hypothetical protein